MDTTSWLGTQLSTEIALPLPFQMYLSEAHWVTHTHTHTQTNDIILCTKQGTDTKLVECPPLLQRIQRMFILSVTKLTSFV